MKLTLPQQDIYFEQLLYPSDPIYNIGAKIEIIGTFDFEVLRRAYIEMISQHDAYRSIFIAGNNEEEINVEIIEEHKSDLGFIDFSIFENSIEKALEYMESKFSIPINLFNNELLHSFTLIKVKENHYFLFSMYHHIITDGWGTSLMFQRLVQNYNELFAFGSVKTEYPFSYKDFAKDDFEYQNSSLFSDDKDYWTEKYESLPGILFEKINKSAHICKSERKELIIKRELYNDLNNLAAKFNCSTFNLILAIFYIYFGRKYQNNDFAIGLPVLNRSKAKYKKTVGLFMGVSPLRMNFSFNENLHDFVQRIKKQLRNDYRHQRFPIGKIIKEMNLFHEKERLFNVILSYEKQDYSLNFVNTKTAVIPLTHKSERAALSIFIREFDQSEDVKIDFDYNCNYFNESTIDQLINQFQCLISDVLNNPDRSISELNFLDHFQRSKILFDFNNTQLKIDENKTVVSLITECARLDPGKIAIFDDLKSYSYQELDKVSNNIARLLLNLQGKHDKSPIAVLMNRSVDIIPILLGILKSGRPYLPLDPMFPVNRLNHIISDSKTKIILSDQSCEKLFLEGTEVLQVKNFLNAENTKNQNNYNFGDLSSDSAYIIYTSGTTGIPKGVEITHKALLNFLLSMQNNPGIKRDDLLFAVTTYSFDISILEFFGPLISGAKVYVANNEVLLDPSGLITKLEIINPTMIQATPSFYQMLFNAGWRGSKRLKILCGGDSLSNSLAEKLLNSCDGVWNMYGPTETTIWSSLKKITHFRESSNIGKPINNTQFYILDEFLNPLPIGSHGFLYIGGSGLAKGYFNNEKLSNEKFVTNPFLKKELIYSTGDIARWNFDGEIEFIGRSDNQIKIRGFRIEMDDIENQLNRISEVIKSVVIAKKEHSGEYFLAAFIERESKLVDEEYILKNLQMELPYYMIPQAVIFIDEFPLTPNQKIDRKKLNDMEITKQTTNFLQAETYIEKKITELWTQILNYENPIGLDDNFFALGGHSLNAVKLTRLIAENLSVHLVLRDIFDHSTVRLMARIVENKDTLRQNILHNSEKKEFYNLTPSQNNIWLSCIKPDVSIAYNMNAAYEVEGDINYNMLNDSLRNILLEYEILRTNFVEINGIPFQRINLFENINFEISVNKLKTEMVRGAINKFANTRFDLETDLLIRVEVLEIEDARSIMLFGSHHIIMDGLSIEVLIGKWIENYNNFFFKAYSEPKIVKNQFRDYSEMLNKTLSSDYESNHKWWKKYLENFRFERSFERDFENYYNENKGQEFEFELDCNIVASLKKIAVDHQTTIFTVLISVLNLLIYKLSDQNDICIGMVNSGRDFFDLDKQIGMFAKTVPMRTQINENESLVTILRNTKDNILELKKHEDFPFSKFSKSIFDVLVVYQNPNFSYETINEFNDFTLRSYPIKRQFARAPLVFNFFDFNGVIKCVMDYNAFEYEKTSINYLALKYAKVLQEIIKNPEAECKMIDIKLEFEENADFDFNF